MGKETNLREWVRMPIYKTEGCTQLHFGFGDIEVGPGMLEGENIGAVCFWENHEPKKIGETINHEPNLGIPITTTPVRMIFEKVESIDVVIRALEKAKKMMLEKHQKA